MNHIDILKKAREIITDPRAWTKGTTARDADGCWTNPDASDAVCFCSLGAVEKAFHDFGFDFKGDDFETYRAVVGALQVTLKATSSFRLHNPTSVASFNDTHEHADALGLFDRTIAREEAADGQQ